MGNVFPGIPEKLVAHLAGAMGLTTFVETGTEHGNSALAASRIFSRVFTIELSEQLYRQARARLAGIKSVTALHGQSAERLKEILPMCGERGEGEEGEEGGEPGDGGGRCLVWLDAHWTGVIGSVTGVERECPVLEELEVINALGGDCVILIDDARFFLGPPPPPHRAEHWPDLATVLGGLNPPHRPRYTIVRDDVIVSVPLAGKQVLVDFCRAPVSNVMEIKR